MEIFEPGTPVIINGIGAAGFISAATVRKTGVIYEINYWSEGEYRQVPLEDFEFKPAKQTKRTKIGFCKDES